MLAQSELMSPMAGADPGVSAFPDGNSLFSWAGTIQDVDADVPQHPGRPEQRPAVSPCWRRAS